MHAHCVAVLQEYILQGVVHAALGQQKQDADMMKAAQQYFQLVGASASECDTIPGRQCMASCFHLLGQFDDVLIFLNSILQVRCRPRCRRCFELRPAAVPCMRSGFCWDQAVVGTRLPLLLPALDPYIQGSCFGWLSGNISSLSRR